MKGKHVLITGANAGIGKATAKGLLMQGAKISMFCRNKSKAEEAKKDLIKETGNSDIDIFIVDFLSFKSIEKACNEFKTKYSKLDVLMNNAGATFSDFELSEDGIERTMALNHFGYFLTTFYLMPLLKAAKDARIVSVSSKAHYGGNINFDTINEEKGYFVFKQYEHSKLANVLFTKYLARKLDGSGITVNCLHPGVVKTKIGNKSGNWFHSVIWSLFASFGISTDKGAATSIYLASSPEVESVSGMYFDKKRGYKGSETSNNIELQDALWKWSEGKTGKNWAF